MSFSKKVAVRPLFYLLVGLVFGYLLYHSLAGDTFLAASTYDSYSIQAENWLAGRCYLAGGEAYTWLELAIYKGQYYLSFPPVPSVVLLPWVILCGSAAAVPSNFVIILFALGTVAGVYLLFAQFGASAQTCLFWAMLSCVGSNFFWLSTNGGVWFMAQVLNLFFVVWGLYCATKHTLWGNGMAAFLLALAVGCRPFSILLLALFLCYLWVPKVKQHINPLQWGSAFWLAFVAAALVGFCLAVYNYIRFGSILEFGHNYLPEFTQAEHGQFHLCYFWGNLKGLFSPITFNENLGLEFSIFNGFFLFAANPIYLLALITLVQRVYKGKFTWQEGTCVALLLVSIAFLCCHKTMGGWQFGARYLVDSIPYLWLAQLFILHQKQVALAKELAPKKAKKVQKVVDALAPENPTDWQWFLCAMAMAFNIYGAIFMLQ